MTCPNRFQGRTAIVTGGAAGIGLDIATRLAVEGASVSLWDMKEDGLAEAKPGAGAAHTHAVDVAPTPVRSRQPWPTRLPRWAVVWTCWCAAPG